MKYILSVTFQMEETNSNHTDQSLRMSMRDCIDVSLHSNPNANNHSLGETDLRLGLSLSSSTEPSPCLKNSGMNPVRVLKRVYSEAMGGNDGEEEKKCLVRLQMSLAVGWPSIRSYRKNSIAGQERIPAHKYRWAVQERVSDNFDGEKEVSSNFVKVSMDGIPIGRKVDLNAHNSYYTLAVALQNMFQLRNKKSTNPNPNPNSNSNSNHRRVLDPFSGYLLTYLDKDGDWMLVGDAPWRMFVNSVKRLRIAKIQK